MKLQPHTYRSWWDLHAWAGLLCSLVVYVFFFFGSWTLFHAEMAIWQEPRGAPPSLGAVDQILAARLEDGSISRASLRLNFPRPRSPGFSISYQDAAGDRQDRYIERQGLVEPRSNVADFLYGMHYLQFPSAPRWLYTLAGIASAVLLLVLISGVLIHVRDLVRQFHQFRPHKRLQVLWSDAHKVLGTIGLPFAAVYAFTGAWMGLDSVLSSSLTAAAFHGDDRAVELAFSGAPSAPAVTASKLPATRLPLADLLRRAEAARPAPEQTDSGQRDCRSVYLHETGDREATAGFYCGDAEITLRQRDGVQIFSAVSPSPALSSRISAVPYALHFVEFAHTPLRVVYLLLGLAACVAILTGNWLWLARRVPSRATWVVQRFTLLFGVGSLIAGGSLLVASRFGISASFERQVFWWTWLAVSVVCCAGRDARALWRPLLQVGGGVFGIATLPGLFGLLLGGDHSQRPPVAVVVDLALMGFGLALLLLARALRDRGRSRSPGVPFQQPEPVDVG